MDVLEARQVRILRGEMCVCRIDGPSDSEGFIGPVYTGVGVGCVVGVDFVVDQGIWFQGAKAVGETLGHE